LDAQGSLCRLPIFGLALSFSAFDWLMGLNYRWFSTMWGRTFLPEPPVARCRCSSRGYRVAPGRLPQSGDAGALSHHGKWMLAFSVFWAYIGFSQYMLYWYANIPEETQYLSRPEHRVVVAAELLLVVGRFFGPFAILLLQGIKKRRISFPSLRLDHAYAGARYVSDRAALASRHRCSLEHLGFPLPIAIGCSLAFLICG
jgi:hypothetical protein